MNHCHLPKRNREIPSAEAETKVIASHFLDCQFFVRRKKSEKWNGFLDLTQLWDPVDDTNEECVLWCDVVAEVDVL